MKLAEERTSEVVVARLWVTSTHVSSRANMLELLQAIESRNMLLGCRPSLLGARSY